MNNMQLSFQIYCFTLQKIMSLHSIGRDTYPLERDWQKRLPATQLYPLLVHAVLFGGHYISAAKNIMVSF